MPERFWEIDFFRGLAVIAMVVFHFLFDLYYFKGYLFNLQSGLLWAIGRFAGISFLLLVGISLTISHYRAKQKNENLFFKFLKRGTMIFSFGLLVTIVTFLFAPQGTIFFGILHLIGLSIILAVPFIEKKRAALFFGVMFLFIGLYLQQFYFSFPWLAWLGFYPENIYTFDYYPLLPWFGIVLIGVFVGNVLYPNAKQKFAINAFPLTFPLDLVCFLGKNSLAIYLIHQLFLISAVLLFF